MKTIRYYPVFLLWLVPVIAIGAFGIFMEARGANFPTHAGCAEDTNASKYFVAGAMLADLDHFLPGSFHSDTRAVALKLLSGARLPKERLFALGWYEHAVDQDPSFSLSVNAIQKQFPKYKKVYYWKKKRAWWGTYYVLAYRSVYVGPKYSLNDIRLAFDYRTLTRHASGVSPLFVARDGDLLDLLAFGLDYTYRKDQIQDAVYKYVFQLSLSDPGLLAQEAAALGYGGTHPGAVRDMGAEYENYYRNVTSGYYNP